MANTDLVGDYVGIQ